MSRFFPKSEAERRAWYLSFKQNLPYVSGRMAVNPHEVQAIDANLDVMIADIDDVNQTELANAASVENRNGNRERLMPNVLNFINRLKNQTDYLKAYGESLGIELSKPVKAAKMSTSIEDLQVTITINVQKVSFKFKKPRAVLVAIYCRRTDGAFELIRQVSGNTYEDIRPNFNGQGVERREYYFTLIKDDKEGDRSSLYPVAVLQ